MEMQTNLHTLESVFILLHFRETQTLYPCRWTAKTQLNLWDFQEDVCKRGLRVKPKHVDGALMVGWSKRNEPLHPCYYQKDLAQKLNFFGIVSGILIILSWSYSFCCSLFSLGLISYQIPLKLLCKLLRLTVEISSQLGWAAIVVGMQYCCSTS